MQMSLAPQVPGPRREEGFGARPEPLIRIRELLFPSDLSAESDRAFEHARLLAERFSAPLTLYHAVEVPDPSYAHWAFNRGREIWLHVEQTARELLVRVSPLVPACAVRARGPARWRAAVPAHPGAERPLARLEAGLSHRRVFRQGVRRRDPRRPRGRLGCFGGTHPRSPERRGCGSSSSATSQAPRSRLRSTAAPCGSASSRRRSWRRPT